MISRKKFRFGERPTPASSTDLQLTQEDAQNLESYISTIKQTLAILRREIDGVKAGELEVVGEVFEEKSRFLKWLELRTPLVEPFLNHEFAIKLKIREHLSELKQSIEEDGAILSRMAIAARTILREVEKINKRNGLDNVYGQSGQRLSGASSGKASLDQEL